MKDAPAVAATIDQYIAGHAPAVQARLAAMRATIRQYAPAAEERISYGIPTFHLGGNLVHFAAFAKHVGFYPGPTGIAAFQEALACYKSAKGSVQFPHADPMPLELVAAIVQFRVAEQASRSPRHVASQPMSETNRALPPGVLLVPPGAGRHYPCGPMHSEFLADGEETGNRYWVSLWWVDANQPVREPDHGTCGRTERIHPWWFRGAHAGARRVVRGAGHRLSIGVAPSATTVQRISS